jgi:hypothetical protein
VPPRPRTIAASIVGPAHPDFAILSPIEQDIYRRISQPQTTVPEQLSAALEFVLDPVRTGRTHLSQLDNVEKTFVGLKVEHFLRDLLDAPKGIRDLELAGQNVDVKNTVGDSWSWMIPPETYRDSEPCLLAAIDEPRREVWLGLIVAKPDYLGKPNRDLKRGILSKSYENILWLLKAAPLPRDPWVGIDMRRFLELRKMVGGRKRAAAFFRENLRRPVLRSVLEALLYDQNDPMKRLRANHGAKDILKDENIALLSGKYFKSLLAQLGFPHVESDEYIAIDGRSEEDGRLLRGAGQF